MLSGLESTDSVVQSVGLTLFTKQVFMFIFFLCVWKGILFANNTIVFRFSMLIKNPAQINKTEKLKPDYFREPLQLWTVELLNS